MLITINNRLSKEREFDEAKIILRNSSLKTLQIQNTTEYLRQFLQSKRSGRSNKRFNRCLALNSFNGWALMMMGNIFARHKKDSATAMKYYDQAIVANTADHYF
jgi:hypothetical protein